MGEFRRRAGTGQPLRELRVEDPDGVVPARIRNVLERGDLAYAVATSIELAGKAAGLLADRQEFVVWCRQHGLSWDSIGWFLGITGSSVRQQYGAVLEELDL